MNLSSSASYSDTRKPAVAGMFYPGDAKVLSSDIDKYLENAKAESPKGDIVTLIVPHAGYEYSAQVAAYAYKLLEGRQYNNVILVGASHRKAFEGVAACDYDSFETPLGKVPVDKEAVRELMKVDNKIFIDNAVHAQEHALEVQVPFLQKTLKDFKITPLLLGSTDPGMCVKLADDIFRISDDKTLVIASTDWSHYYDYKTAVKLDSEGLEAVKENDPDKLLRCAAEGKSEACGLPAVLAAMLYAGQKAANVSTVLKYANSGDVTGDRSKVVGYAAAVFSRDITELNASEKKTALKLARTTLENHYLGTNKAVEISSPALLRKSGAFVTLNKGGRLRGCIGMIRPVEPLNKAIEHMAMAAALEDTRFTPVTKEELPALHIEISVLSPLKRIKSTDEIKVGRDGIYLVSRGRSGIFLPQVPGMFGWDLDEYLKQICGKAGLPPDAWKDKDAQLYTFTAQVFGE